MIICTKNRQDLCVARDSGGTPRVPQMLNMGVARWFLAAVLLLFFAALVVPPAEAQTAEEIKTLKKQMKAVHEAQAALEKEVQDIRKILLRLLTPPPGASAGAEISLAGRPARGLLTAKITIVEFSDYQSKDSARYFADTYPKIDRAYIQPGKARYVLKNFPNQNTHPQSFKAHEAAACAGEQGRFWEMHARLFANQEELEPEELVIHAKTLGLKVGAFRKCLESGRYAPMIWSDFEEGTRGGVRGTPVFAIGFTEPGGSSLRVRRVVVGSQPYSVFEEAIEAVLAMEKDTS